MYMLLFLQYFHILHILTSTYFFFQYDISESKKGNPLEMANQFELTNHFERVPWRAASSHRAAQVMRTAAAASGGCWGGRYMNDMNDVRDMNDMNDMNDIVITSI